MAKTYVPLTLVFPVIRGEDGKVTRVLLGYKKRGFGQHKWNGFGGKLEQGETIEQAAKRELKEESGLETETLLARGVNEFEFEGDPKILMVYIFETENFTGTPTECDEMRPQWFDLDQIPFQSMWIDDSIWLPKVLSSRAGALQGYFLFRGHDTILSHTLEVLDIVPKIYTPLTLVFPVIRDVDGKVTKVLLGYKKRGFGKDKWDGFGGKVEQGETI